MRSFLVALATFFLVASAYSAAPAADDKKLTPQQEKMKSCNAEAGDKKGDERKAFMSTCLKAGAPAAPMTQQDKMKKCNADASAIRSDTPSRALEVSPPTPPHAAAM